MMRSTIRNLFVFAMLMAYFSSSQVDAASKCYNCYGCSEKNPTTDASVNCPTADYFVNNII